MMSAVAKPLRLSLLLASAALAPFVLTAIYVIAMHGRALSPNALHQAVLGIIILSPIPFIAALPLGRSARGVLGIVLVIALFFTAGDIGFWFCVQFGWPP
jgi:hypothetical protein